MGVHQVVGIAGTLRLRETDDLPPASVRAVGLYSLALRRADLVPAWLAIGGIVVADLLLGSFIRLHG
jgi:hypothetical protein